MKNKQSQGILMNLVLALLVITICGADGKATYTPAYKPAYKPTSYSYTYITYKPATYVYVKPTTYVYYVTPTTYTYTYYTRPSNVVYVGPGFGLCCCIFILIVICIVICKNSGSQV